METHKLFCAGLLFVVIGAGTSDAAEKYWTPNPEQIARLERNLEMPPFSHPLKEYGRYYWGEYFNGKRFIQGDLVRGKTTGLHLRDRPLSKTATFMNCNWVFVTFWLDKKESGASCDGIP